MTIAGADGAILTASDTNHRSTNHRSTNHRSTDHRPGTTQARAWWWGHDQRRGNLGDAVNLVVLGAFGVTAHRNRTTSAPWPDTTADQNTPTLLAVGSSVSDRVVTDRHNHCVVWGSGWRGDPVSDTTLELLDVRAVRGPHTAAALGLTGQVPMGDPALLLPYIIDAHAHPWWRRSTRSPSGNPSPNAARRAIVVPHLSQMSGAPEVGCDQTVTTGVRQVGLLGGFITTDVVRRVHTIANASFVLTGSLHAAIIAQAYGVPWAPWGGPDVDCPAKWDDWAAYLGIELRFVPDRAAGEKWWTEHGSAGRVGDLTSMVEAFPYDALGLAAPQSPRLTPMV